MTGCSRGQFNQSEEFIFICSQTIVFNPIKSKRILVEKLSVFRCTNVETKNELPSPHIQLVA